MRQAHDAAPDAAKIAAILRSPLPWPQGGSAGAPDLGRQLVPQPRQVLPQFSPALGPALGAGALEALAGAGDFKVSLLAERVSVLLAGLQRECDSVRQDADRQAEGLALRFEARLGAVENRVAACEDKAAAQELRIDTGLSQERAAREAAQIVREAQSQFSSMLTEVQSRWHAQHLELQVEQRESLRHLEELAQRLRHTAGRVSAVEDELRAQEHARRALDERLRHADAGQPAWLGEVDAALRNVERRLNDQQVASEVQLGRLRAELEAAVRGSEAGRGADARLERELARLASTAAAVGGRGAGTAASAPAEGPGLQQGKRLDDLEARLAAIRVRVDSHDGRFGALGERVEAACEQALEAARRAVAEQREEVLSEADCQISMLRQRVESLGEACEELMMQRAHRGSSR